jgi:mevalonate kinase
MSVLTDQGWKDDKIFEVTMKGETIAHGTPSGIDPACATYGSLILFEKNMEGGKNKIQPFKLGAPLYLVLADTVIKHDTKEAVMDVRKRKEANPAEYEKIFSDYKTLVGKAKTALKFGETIEVGKLMNENHELLKKIGVSIPEIENIIKVMNYSNALGAKITGAGMGGNVIGLCENEKHQDKMLATLESKGIKAIKTKIN